jgi:DNA-binding NtrC family response regulator
MADDLSSTDTMSSGDPVPSRAAPTAHASLLLIVNRDRLRERSLRIQLTGATSVLVRRGDANQTSIKPVPSALSGLFGSLELASLKVTKVHAEFGSMDGVGWHVMDEGSKNGTIVDGVRVAPRIKTRLRHGSTIEIGPYVFMFIGKRPETLPSGVPMSIEREAHLLEAGLPTFNAPLAASFEKLRKVATKTLPVLVLGETGTGKERVARAVHDLSGRRGVFSVVNCGAIQPSTMLAELFGHTKRAFTGADQDRAGLIRAADGGTLFLDEVGDLSAQAQSALLRTLQEREVLPVGADHPVKVDVRIVAATNYDLTAMTRERRFRPDLLERLRGFELVLPTLRQRPEDFGLIVRDIMSRRGLAQDVHLSTAAYVALRAYSWPQNIRELENVLVGAASLAEDNKNEIDVHHLPEGLQASRPGTPAGLHRVLTKAPAFDPGSMEDVLRLLALHRGNVEAVARACGVDQSQIRRFIKRHKIDVNKFRKGGQSA